MKDILTYLTFLSVCVMVGCASTNHPLKTGKRAHYTSAFPTRNVSQKLVQIQQSVQHIGATALYRTYSIGKQNVTLGQLNRQNLKNQSYRRLIIDRHKAGTAVTILRNKRATALISARHVVFFPDTTVIYKKGENIPENKYVKSIGIKTKQNVYLLRGPNARLLDVIAKEKKSDLCLMIFAHPDEDEKLALPLRLKMGNPRQLQPGSFLYILGYPFGSPMVTRGIVSAPNYDRNGRFLTDALFNHGISGGLIVATNDNFKSFEWVGMAATASATKQNLLVPKPLKKKQYRNHQPYTGDPYILKKQIINYGITSATPVNIIKLFLLQNEDKLNRFGLSFRDFY